MNANGVYAGSFDPITNGHMNVIKQACKLFDTVHVAIGINPAKKYHMGTQAERQRLVEAVLDDELSPEDRERVHVICITTQFLIDFATKIEATHLIRGIRNTLDFEYENGIQDINREINPDIDTVFIIPPANLKSVSSSVVKGFVGFDGWEVQVARKVNPIIVEALKKIAQQ